MTSIEAHGQLCDLLRRELGDSLAWCSVAERCGDQYVPQPTSYFECCIRINTNAIRGIDVWEPTPGTDWDSMLRHVKRELPKVLAKLGIREAVPSCT